MTDQISLFGGRGGGKVQFQGVVDEFHRAFESRYGRKPTWTGKTLKLVKTLIAKHGADEVIARIAVMFGTTVSWPPHPRTVAVLSAHFDTFIPLDPEVKVSPQAEWEAVAALMGRYGRTISRENYDAMMRDENLMAETRAAIRDAGWYNLCGMSAEKSKFAFYAAFKKARM